MQITNRPRRLRKSPAIRSLFREVSLLPQNLIQPLFAVDKASASQPIPNLFGVFRLGLKEILLEISECTKLGITSFIIFPYVEQSLKNSSGSYGYSQKNFLISYVKKIKAKFPHINLICDIALDPYTSHGHDGILNKNGDVDNDKTIEVLCRQALLFASAGADSLAPSDMMDGRIEQIRNALDAKNFQDKLLISYSAKYASNLYAPFRSAIGSDKNLKKADKKTYQMDFSNSREAIKEAALDVSEGADALIIKPANFYADVIFNISQSFDIPVIAYQVSGEYSMLCSFAQGSSTNMENILEESLICLRRAGATAIITYGAKIFAKKFHNENKNKI